MAPSKEAWEHFLFVPHKPSRRIERRAARATFLEANCKSTLISRRCGQSDRSAVALQRSSRDSLAAGAAVTAAGAAAAAAAALAPGVPAAAGMMKLCMMVPPPPPPLAAAYQQNSSSSPQVPQAGPGGIFELLFPNFDTDTFIWRISVLQMVEYGGSLLLGSVFGAPKLCSLYLLGASWGPAIANGALWRLVLPMTLHANALHIFFNVFFQLRIGCSMEKQFGRRKFCLLYLFCGFVGNLLSVASDPMKLAVGASTSGFGLLGVWAAEVLLTWELLGESRPRVFLWFAFMLLSCIMMSTISPNVDFMGHFGGALAGFLLAIILADMREEHQPSWYGSAKLSAKNTTALLVLVGLVKAITLGPEGPIPYCGSIFYPRQLPF